MKHTLWLIYAAIGLAIRIYIIETLSEGDNYYEGSYNMFTDLDYKVYLDASLYDSPYQRHTYRYSPLLAWIMSPSYKYNQKFGKYVLAVFDLIAAFFFYKIYADRKGQQNVAGGVVICTQSYLNPFMIYLSIRGSCEGITMTLGAAFWYFYFGGEANGNMSANERREKGLIERQPNTLKKYISYVLFGLWVHFRVYPIIMVPLLIMYEYHSAPKDKLKHTFKFILQFGLVSGGVFIALAAYFYSLYGYDFLHETYIYHIARRDNRHSRSVYFYDLYLNYTSDALYKPLYRVLCRNMPTYVMIFAFSFYFIRKRSLFACHGFITLYFVIFNRVITDQYYMWLFTYLYMIMAETKQYKEGRWLALIGQGLIPYLSCAPTVIFWAFFKYQLEHSSHQWTIIYFWGWNVLNLIVQNMIISYRCCKIIMSDQQKKQFQLTHQKTE